MKKKLIYILGWLPPLALAAWGRNLYQILPTQFLGLTCYSLAGLLGVYYLLDLFGLWQPVTAKVLRSVLSYLVVIGLAVVGVTAAFVARDGLGTQEPNAPVILVLGAKVNGTQPSQTLRQRIDAAEDYLLAHPRAVAVLSGGQGPDEGISEAQCMFEQLTGRGISADRLILEERSTSTWENLSFSLALMEERLGQLPETVGIVTSEFHLCRAGFLAGELGLQIQGIPAKTENPVFFANYFLREIAGIWHHIILGG